MRASAHRRPLLLAAAATTAAAFAALSPRPPAAAAEPEGGTLVAREMAYAGTLARAGEPVDGTVTLGFRLYAEPTGGAPLWAQPPAQVRVERGAFEVTLTFEDDDAFDRLLSAQAWFLEVDLFDADTLYTLAPRSKLTTLPFSFRAQRAAFANVAVLATDAETLQGNDVSAFARSSELASHVADTRAHAPRYTDGEAVRAVSAAGFVPGRYTDADAVSAVRSAGYVPGQYTDADALSAVAGAGYVPGQYTDANARAAMGEQTVSNPLNHPRYTNNEAIAAMGPKAPDNPLNHDRYTDIEARAAMGALANGNPYHHTRYTDAEAVAAMGAKGPANPLNHDRYTDAEALAAVAAAGYPRRAVSTLDTTTFTAAPILLGAAATDIASRSFTVPAGGGVLLAFASGALSCTSGSAVVALRTSGGLAGPDVVFPGDGGFSAVQSFALGAGSTTVSVRMRCTAQAAWGNASGALQLLFVPTQP